MYYDSKDYESSSKFESDRRHKKKKNDLSEPLSITYNDQSSFDEYKSNNPTTTYHNKQFHQVIQSSNGYTSQTTKFNKLASGIESEKPPLKHDNSLVLR